MADSVNDVVLEVQGRMGLVTLNRPRALNALSLPMIRALTTGLLTWRDDPQVLAVAVRGMSKGAAATQPGAPTVNMPFGAFCAGGDIRFFHQAALAGDPALEDFFTEEYALNHLIHTYPKPFIAMMDGVVMGGGMGIAQGGSLRLVTERTKMAMPETQIGLFPDVGGGYFLSRCPGRLGEYLALTGLVCFTGFLASYLFNVYFQHGAPGSFVATFASFTTTSDMQLAMVKAVVYGAIVGVVACQKGLSTSGGSIGVANAVNSSVVESILLLMISNVAISQMYLILFPKTGL